MDWIRTNRFLAFYLGILVPALLALGYLVYSSATRYSQISGDYQTQVAELKRLQGLDPYPDASSVQRIGEMRKEIAASVADLQTHLAQRAQPPEVPPPTPLQFQDRLRQVVDDMTKSARQAGVGLPENFYLGFEQYRGTPPDTAATPALSAELNAIRDLIDLLIKQRVESLVSIKRAPLPHEAGAGSAAGAVARKGPAGKPGEDLITLWPVQIEITALPSAFRGSINAITTAPHLYVVSLMNIKSGSDKVPARGEGSVNLPGGTGRNAPTAPPPPPGAVDQNGVPVPPLPEKTAPPLRYIFGLEKVDAVALIELATVAPAH